MDFRDFTYIIALSKYQNITKAANSLYITQPTMTKFLQKTESELGQKLFNRIGNKLVLTYAGERYVQRAAEIINLKKELDAELHDIGKSKIGELRVAFPPTRTTYMLSDTVSKFSALYPDIKIKILEENSVFIEKMLLNNEADIAFFNLPIKSPDIEYEVISTEEIMFVTSPLGNTVKNRNYKENESERWVDFEDIKNEPLIMLHKEQRTRLMADRFFEDNGAKPNIKLEIRNIEASARLASMNYASAFICDNHLKHFQLDFPIEVFSVTKGRMRVDFVAAYCKNIYIPYHVREFMNIVKECI